MCCQKLNLCASAQIESPDQDTPFQKSCPFEASHQSASPIAAFKFCGNLTVELLYRSSNGGLSGGAVAGIVIGVLAAAALAIFIAFFACRRKQGGKSVVPQLNGGTFSMPTFDGEFGRYFHPAFRKISFATLQQCERSCSP